MATELHALTVPPLRRGLTQLAAILEKGRAFAEEQGFPPETLLEARLAEDMATLIRQVQLASDSAKFAGARLAGITPPPMADTETSFAELADRVAATIAFLDTIPPEAMQGREETDVTLKTSSRSFEFKALAYLQRFALPNFYFHVTTAYAILRHKGVPLAKPDYLGAF
ncbi:DUF1993 domain-containing protein [Sphingomonas hengshuiensis]|uniref:DUF1993 domain-containing protein n=1 Tax=Sphingomonas hengshuiensis TaxID=1609977 RepID=A0A7U5CV13_9SPHN|nr:DUF1993 domain-containing protein [Sphingomonas hengshuiensis]AJP74432.1 hypothetical protein TS85_10560 [Sphingomonas hengshuiensis]